MMAMANGGWRWLGTLNLELETMADGDGRWLGTLNLELETMANGDGGWRCPPQRINVSTHQPLPLDLRP